MESLTVHPLNASPTALEKFCKAMPHITKMDLSFANRDNKYDRVLRAIAANMHHLKSLNICCCTVDHPKSIEYLLPTEDNTLGGCPELVELDLSCVHNVDVKLLKKIILALPKLRSLNNDFLVNALGNLTEQEMGEDTARCMNSLYANPDSSCNYLARYDILIRSPVFQRLKNNITKVYIELPFIVECQKDSKLLANVLKSLPNLRNVELHNISEVHKHMLPLLEFIGDHIEYLCLVKLSGSLSIQDIMRTCRNLVKLALTYRHFEHNSQRHHNKHHEQVEWPNRHPVLNYITKIVLRNLDKVLCSKEMLIALLQAPNLKNVFLFNLEVMSDDVMYNALSSSPGGAALSKVTGFTVNQCPLMTEAPIVHWLTTENCSLEYMSFYECGINRETLNAAAEKYPKSLIIE